MESKKGVLESPRLPDVNTFVCGDFARAGRSHNLEGGAVSPRQHLLDCSVCVSESIDLLLLNKELATQIPTNIEKIIQISYYPEIPVEHTILQI